MRKVKAVAVGLVGAIGAGTIVLASLVQFARPDLLTMILSGSFGSSRSAIGWLYSVRLEANVTRR